MYKLKHLIPHVQQCHDDAVDYLFEESCLMPTVWIFLLPKHLVNVKIVVTEN